MKAEWRIVRSREGGKGVGEEAGKIWERRREEEEEEGKGGEGTHRRFMGFCCGLLLDDVADGAIRGLLREVRQLGEAVALHVQSVRQRPDVEPVAH